MRVGLLASHSVNPFDHSDVPDLNLEQGLNPSPYFKLLYEEVGIEVLSVFADNWPWVLVCVTVWMAPVVWAKAVVLFRWGRGVEETGNGQGRWKL